MRKKLHIALYWVVAGFTCFLISCGPSREEKDNVNAMYESNLSTMEDNQALEDTFEIDTLNTVQLNVFQQRARQKLQDFINYMEIISNKSYDLELRLIASKQIEDLFAVSTVFVSISIAKEPKNKKTVSQFLNEIYLSDYDSIKVKTDSVVISKPEKSTESIKYIGEVTAKVNIDGYKNGEVIFNSIAIQKAETIITKTQKQFGDETKMVWTASIGELK